MPEEINRIVCDHVSSILFAPTQTAINNLKREGFIFDSTKNINIDNPAIFLSGDIMYDNALYYKNKAKMPDLLKHLNNDFILVTIHREQNTDNIDNLNKISQILIDIAEEYKLDLIFPVHPRTIKALEMQLPKRKQELDAHPRVHLINPVSYLEVLALLQECKMVITDSGGLQKEAYFVQKPCVILRTETEWIEIVEQGAGIITNIDTIKIKEAIQHYLRNGNNIEYKPIFGNGHTAEFICEKLIEIFK
jgi:UDP-GlcNAc3NAcA epimerase